MEQAIKDTMPYFLGAAPRDQALKRVRLREARRAFTRATAALTNAEQAAQAIDGQLRALLAEANAVGLTAASTPETRADVLDLLEQITRTPVNDAGRPGAGDAPNAEQDARRRLLDSQAALRERLRGMAAERQLLLDTFDGQDGYVGALNTQVGRLASLGLLPAPGGSVAADDQCPLCGSALAEPDPSPAELRVSLELLQQQLLGIEDARPARRAALAAIEDQIAGTRADLRGVDAALRALVEGDEAIQDTEGEQRRAFTRGRISATLATANRADDSALRRLQHERDVAARRVEALEAELDDDEERMQLESRLASLSGDMTRWSQQLLLEHGDAVRLDLNRLTVVTETDQGPAPLWRIGSAENWIGAHLVTHLALHRYFVTHSRPVPRLLLLDQPTQAYYPSELEQETGVPSDDSDREAVRRMFQLLLTVAEELAPSMQIIVCDHANLPEEWFRSAVVHNWRDGKALIPQEWLAASAS
jgi:predicted  nucleic acid-binding Zn-ribbon protein